MLASTRSQLWPEILVHPNCYAALADWICVQMRDAPNPYNPPKGMPSRGRGFAQMETARPMNLPGGARGPVIGGYSVMDAGPYGQPHGGSAVVRSGAALGVAASLIGVISVFLPLATAMGFSIGYFDVAELSIVGLVILGGFGLSAGLMIALVVNSASPLRVGSGVTAVLFAVVSLAYVIFQFAQSGNTYGVAHLGSGLVVHGFAAVLLLIAGAIVLAGTSGKRQVLSDGVFWPSSD